MRDHVALWVAIAAAAPGVIALILCGLMWRTLRQVRHDQQVLLPEGARAGLVDRQASLQRGIERVEEEIRSLRDQSDARQRATDERLRGALRFQGLVRYDAYRDMGGQQSWSIALLDATRTGAVVTSLHARDHARVYLKEMAGGVANQRLSPEEERAVALAMGDQVGGEAA